MIINAVRILGFLLLLLAVHSPVRSQPQAAIIIDDLGYRASELAAIRQPGQFSYAILPFTPYARTLAEAAHRQRKEVLVHLPMEPLGNKNPGPGAILADLSASEIRRRVRLALRQVPYAVGVNNHMGSKISQLPASLAPILDTLQQRGLFVIDSLTTANSQILPMARARGIPALERQIFLDNDPTPAYIRQQLARLVQHARLHGHAVGIAHPYPQTLAMLTYMEDTLRRQGIMLVPVSRLVEQPSGAWLAAAEE